MTKHYDAILAARPDGTGPIADRYFFQVVGYDGVSVESSATLAVFELTAEQYELASGFAGSFVAPSSPGFDLSTDPRSPKYDRARADAAEALFERFLEGEGPQASLPLSREELINARGVVTFTAD